MAREKKVRETPRGIPFESVLARHMRSPAFREGFEKRRLIHEVAVAVRTMRENAGLTQEQLAKAIGTSQPTIARLERGLDQRTPRFDVLRRIAAALGKQMKIRFENAPGSKPQQLVEVVGVRLRRDDEIERGR